MRVLIYLIHDVNSGKKHPNQITHSVPMEEFPTLQGVWCSIIPGSHIKGLISGVHKISWFPKTETISLPHAKMQLVSGVARWIESWWIVIRPHLPPGLEKICTVFLLCLSIAVLYACSLVRTL